MSIPRQTPRRIDVNERVRQRSVVEDSASQGPFNWLLGTKLRHDDQRRGPAGARQRDDRTKDLTRDADARLDGFIAAIRHQQPGERDKPRVLFGWHPDEAGPKPRPIVVEVPSEKRRHEERDYGQRSAKAR